VESVNVGDHLNCVRGSAGQRQITWSRRRQKIASSTSISTFAGAE
jgi:hypothetical protein